MDHLKSLQNHPTSAVSRTSQDRIASAMALIRYRMAVREVSLLAARMLGHTLIGIAKAIFGLNGSCSRDFKTTEKSP